MIETLSLIYTIHPEILASRAMYLDPGSGSFLLQILIATIAGAGIFLAASWRKVKTFFVDLFAKKQEPKQPAKNKDE